MRNIHPTAVVSPRSEIADGVEIGPFTVVDDDVVIGEGCRLSSSVRLHSGVRLARGVRVFHGAALGGEPQDLKFTGEKSLMLVGDNTVIREFVTLSRGTKATGRTVIGRDCMLMAYAHVAHDCTIGDNVILANSVNLAGHVEVEDYAIIGGIVPIHQFVRIGRHAMIGGGLRVPKDVPPYIMAAGAPLRYFGINAIGLRRRGFSAEARSAIKQAYQILFQSSLNTSQAVERIRSELGAAEEVRIILEFIAKSRRGLLPGNRALAGEVDES
jgi:UDP-N-acetylglucosamine acyltransferase